MLLITEASLEVSRREFTAVGQVPGQDGVLPVSPLGGCVFWEPEPFRESKSWVNKLASCWFHGPAGPCVPSPTQPLSYGQKGDSGFLLISGGWEKEEALAARPGQHPCPGSLGNVPLPTSWTDRRHPKPSGLEGRDSERGHPSPAPGDFLIQTLESVSYGQRGEGFRNEPRL